MLRGIYPLLIILIISLSGACKKGKSGVDSTGSTGSDSIPPPTPAPSSEHGLFLYGSNMGAYQGWSDEQLAEILIGNPDKGIAGAGVKDRKSTRLNSSH